MAAAVTTSTRQGGTVMDGVGGESVDSHELGVCEALSAVHAQLGCSCVDGLL